MSESFNCMECEISSNCFKELIPSELEFINTKKTQITYKKGENICKQGAFASYVLYISKGQVKLYLENINNKYTNIKILKASEFIGLSSVFDKNIYSYSAIALKDTNVCLIEKDGIKKLLNNNPTFATEIIKGYCKNETFLYDRLKSISYKQMHGRLADTLLYLSSDNFIDENIYNGITRKDIADFACISKESTVKLLTEFKNDGIIEIEGKNIEIIDIEKLKSISKLG